MRLFGRLATATIRTRGALWTVDPSMDLVRALRDWRTQIAFRCVAIALTGAVLALYIASCWWTIQWEGPSDWAVEVDSGLIEICLTDWGEPSFRGAYGRGWTATAHAFNIEIAGRSWDSGPYSAYTYGLWVPLLMASFALVASWPRGRALICRVGEESERVRWACSLVAVLASVSAVSGWWSGIIAAAVAWSGTVWTWREWWKRVGPLKRRYADGKCAACGYPRDGLAPGAVCPECGEGRATDRAAVKLEPATR